MPRELSSAATVVSVAGIVRIVGFVLVVVGVFLTSHGFRKWTVIQQM
jgi:hypothetical protein